MEKLIKTSMGGSLVLAVLFVTLSSFVAMPGAHSFQVYFDSKMVADQYVGASKTPTPRLIVDGSEKITDLVVRYNECNKPVSGGRTLTIKDENDKFLKEWKFEGATQGLKDPMVCKMKDVLGLAKGKAATLKLYYSSNEFTEGTQIAYLIIGDKATAMN